eukprot:2747369-Rhodomonas_salina.1
MRLFHSAVCCYMRMIQCCGQYSRDSSDTNTCTRQPCRFARKRRDEGEEPERVGAGRQDSSASPRTSGHESPGTVALGTRALRLLIPKRCIAKGVLKRGY